MPVVLFHSEGLDLNVVEYRGPVTLAELEALAAFQARNPRHMRRDCLNHVRPGAYFAAVDLRALDALFAHYRTLFAPMTFEIMRRSAWLCESEAACKHVRHWLSGDTRRGMSSAVRQFDTLAEACDWLLLPEAQTGAVARREGFVETASFDRGPSAPAR